MPRPKSIRDEDIIQAAREVFVKRGFHATSAEVARRAGVSEGTLFNRFKTKFDLFRAAMSSELEEPEWISRLADRVGQGDVKRSLVQAGIEGIEFYRRLLPFIFLALSNQSAVGLPVELTKPNPPPVRILKRLARVFDAEMRLKRLRRHDAEVVARSFIGSLMQYVFFEMLMSVQNETMPPAETQVRAFVNLLWNGLAPEANEGNG
jgi:AcrR family transcriptional regulator